MVWLLAGGALSAQNWTDGPGYRCRPLAPSLPGKTGFALLSAAQTGVTFTNSLPSSRSLTNTILPNGSGVAAGDIDGDGLCDLFFAGLGGGSRLYRNLGQWKFEDVTTASGISCGQLEATGTLLADIDGNGTLDLLVNSLGRGAHIFLNDGKGRFTHSPGVLNPGRGGTSLALADTSGNGRLDLYIANYRLSTILDAPGTKFTLKMVNNEMRVASINGRPPTDPEWTNRFRFTVETDAQGLRRWGREELGEPDLFLRNDGRGNFQEVSWTGGAFLDEEGRPRTSAPLDWGLSALFRDFNQDGNPDLYLCNDFRTPDRFWLNDGHGHFRPAPANALRLTSFSSMGADVADLDRDGWDDFMVVDMLSPDHQRRLMQRNSMLPENTASGAGGMRAQYPRNTLFRNRGDGTYSEVAQHAGLEATDWSWAPLFLDVDLDGLEDLLVPNGFERDNMNEDAKARIQQAVPPGQVRTPGDLALRALFPRLATANLAFRNLGDWRFEEAGRQWGFHAATISQGACLADLDNDGDLDVVLNNMNEAAGLYRNETAAPRVAVRLRGIPSNTRGIGARISVTGGPMAQSQEIMCGGRYLSCDDAMRMFAGGASSNRLRIEVRWRGGKRSVIAGAAPNRIYEIEESGASADSAARAAPPSAIPLFADASRRLPHTHQDQPFDDTQRQPLLGKRLSQLGPGTACWDMNGDGIEDLIIGSGKGGAPACFLSDGRGGFSRASQPSWTGRQVLRDQAGIAGWGRGGLLIASANYEDGGMNGGAVFLFNGSNPVAAERAPLWQSSLGPLAAADYDGDGRLDLFAGGRVIGGQYPAAASSRLYRGNGDGSLELDEPNTGRLGQTGLASGAVWSDLDGDGWPELVLACEWGSPQLFRNDRGNLAEIDPPVTLAGGFTPPGGAPDRLSQFTGWWNGVTTGDFDGDGRMDIAASNWGSNTRFERYRARPLRLYYGDFAADGIMQCIEAAWDALSQRYAAIQPLDSVRRAVPFLTARFPTHLSWAQARIEDLMLEGGGTMRMAGARWLETTVFLNRGDRFEARVLPLEAQLAPAFGISAADFDGDGREDLFLSQNFLAVQSEMGRYDAGRGLLLLGDGTGSFRAVDGIESGILLYGQGAGTAVCDFNRDGRADLAACQNSGETRLFLNQRGKAGLRVSLQGPESNPYGIGAQVRLIYQQGRGPSREIHAGAGYWSQDSPVLVLGAEQEPARVWVRWPGGRVTDTPLPRGAREASVNVAGEVRATP